MPQSILVQVGQCGNQCGFRFWHKAVEEYEFYKKSAYEHAIDHFFRPVKSGSYAYSDNFTDCFKARAILIDMEERVITEGCRGPLKNLFSRNQILTDVSGSGNNWAVGNSLYGSKYKDLIISLFRQEAEKCDSLQCFMFSFSIGGGTGSGLGTAALEYLYSEFPKTPRLVFAVYPSAIDDVVTSPYNAVLANNKLTEFSSCVVPFENKALSNLCLRMDKINLRALRPIRGIKMKTGNLKTEAAVSAVPYKPFDDMNNLIAHVISEVTSSTRFPGNLNMDLNDVVTNMTPYPNLHYLISNIAPLLNSLEDNKVDNIFSDLFSDNHNLFDCSLKKGKIIASAILGRGNITLSDIQRNLTRNFSADQSRFTSWSRAGWKIGLCHVPPVRRTRSLLFLANSSAVCERFTSIQHRFLKMYDKKAHLHHFKDVDPDIDAVLKEAIEKLMDLIKSYQSVENVSEEISEQKKVMV